VAKLKTLKSVQANSVARVIVAKELVPKIIKVLQETSAKFIGQQEKTAGA
jgi:hypothetical protein